MDRTGRKVAVLLSVFLALGTACAAPTTAHDAGHQHGDMKHDGGVPMESTGERIFIGAAGPWTLEARLIDMKARFEKQGISAKVIAKLAVWHHLMVILTDPKSGKTVTDVSGEVGIAGPDEASSSRVSLVVMGGHIGSDVTLSKPGKYTFRVEVTGGGGKGSAGFDYVLK